MKRRAMDADKKRRWTLREERQKEAVLMCVFVFTCELWR